MKTFNKLVFLSVLSLIGVTFIGQSAAGFPKRFVVTENHQKATITKGVELHVKLPEIKLGYTWRMKRKYIQYTEYQSEDENQPFVSTRMIPTDDFVFPDEILSFVAVTTNRVKAKRKKDYRQSVIYLFKGKKVGSGVMEFESTSFSADFVPHTQRFEVEVEVQ